MNDKKRRQQGKGPKPEDQTPGEPREFKSWQEAMPKEGLVVVNGHRRKGKTKTVWGIAEMMHKRGRPVTAYRFPKALRDILPDWVNHADELAELEALQGHIIVADEMGQQAHAREHASEGNIEWAKMLGILAQFHHLLLAIYQHNRQMDLSLAMDADLTIFKQPSELHLRFSRKELLPELEMALAKFRTCTGDPRNWMMVVDWHEGRKGFVTAPKPSFWSEDLSTAYALALAKEAEEAAALVVA